MLAAYHVVLGEDVTALGKTTPVYGDALTSEQAEAAGFPLVAILDGINSAALVDGDRLRAALQATRDDLKNTSDERDRLLAALETAERALKESSERLAELERKAVESVASQRLGETAPA
ncbi:MAG: hypothetical protein E6R03_12145 [Hyphomicrobiaceae bacterium]|nr:MAG: hypothetical protein E6R03_12145 [Hyphomicrobiaceae bacterium]